MSQQSVATLTEEIASLEQRQALLKVELQNVSAQILSARKKRTQICAHEKTHTKNEHFEGSYYDRSYTEKSTICSDCGLVLETRRTNVGFYG